MYLFFLLNKFHTTALDMLVSLYLLYEIVCQISFVRIMNRSPDSWSSHGRHLICGTSTEYIVREVGEGCSERFVESIDPSCFEQQSIFRAGKKKQRSQYVYDVIVL